MEADVRRQDARKAMAYDLIQIPDEKPEKESYTTEEIKEIIDICLTI